MNERQGIKTAWQNMADWNEDWWMSRCDASSACFCSEVAQAIWVAVLDRNMNPTSTRGDKVICILP